jgi:hypothetical protein
MGLETIIENTSNVTTIAITLDMLWSGIVPLCGDTPIKINPDTKKVSILDGDLPEGDHRCTGIPPKIENFGEVMGGGREKLSIWFWILLVLLIGLIVLILRK